MRQLIDVSTVYEHNHNWVCVSVCLMSDIHSIINTTSSDKMFIDEQLHPQLTKGSSQVATNSISTLTDAMCWQMSI